MCTLVTTLMMKRCVISHDINLSDSSFYEGDCCRGFQSKCEDVCSVEHRARCEYYFAWLACDSLMRLIHGLNHCIFSAYFQCRWHPFSLFDALLLFHRALEVVQVPSFCFDWQSPCHARRHLCLRLLLLAVDRKAYSVAKNHQHRLPPRCVAVGPLGYTFLIYFPIYCFPVFVLQLIKDIVTEVQIWNLSLKMNCVASWTVYGLRISIQRMKVKMLACD